MEEQAKRPSEILGDQVKEWRRKRNLSAQQLADRVAELGGTLDRVAISKLENGQRGVSLDEALMLAAALNVPPPLLILPLGSESRVRITDESVIHPHLALEWLAGQQPLASTKRLAIGLQEWHEAAERLRFFWALRQAQVETNLAHGELQRAEYVGDEKRLLAARAAFADALKRLSDCLTSMRDKGVTPPTMRDEYLDKMSELGLWREGGDDGER